MTTPAFTQKEQRFTWPLAVRLGAATRASSGAYRLTTLGEQCAAAWGRAVETDETAPRMVEPDTNDLLSYAFLALIERPVSKPEA